MLHGMQETDQADMIGFVAKCWKDDPARNYHPGDFLHWMTNYCKGANLDKRFFVAKSNGQVGAAVEINIDTLSYAPVVAPELRYSDWETHFHVACQAFLRAHADGTKSEITVNLSAKDKSGSKVLAQLGFEAKRADYAVLKRDISAVPAIELPAGFSVRPVEGEHEAQLLADVHNGAFRPKWDAQTYAKVMRAPGFCIENELVVVAPDGQFAAFAVIWPDNVSKSGLFEPVGCKPDFHRLGLTKALMFAGMKRLQDLGMEQAIVGHEPSNLAATNLYKSVGFQPYFETTDFTAIP